MRLLRRLRIPRPIIRTKPHSRNPPGPSGGRDVREILRLPGMILLEMAVTAETVHAAVGVCGCGCVGVSAAVGDDVTVGACDGCVVVVCIGRGHTSSTVTRGVGMAVATTRQTPTRARAAILKLQVAQDGVTSHGIVFPKSGLALANHGI